MERPDFRWVSAPLRNWAVRIVIGVLAGGALHATIIPVSSYSMQNGEKGDETYYDDTYSGVGNNAQPLTFLSGGAGDLTDGVKPISNWFLDRISWVGWFSIDPVITFDLGGVQAIRSVELVVDDSGGSGSVGLPASVSIRVSGGGFNQTFLVTPDADPAPNTLVFNTPGLVASLVDIEVVSAAGNGTWVMVGEVTFDSEIPEPQGLALVCGGLLGLALIRLRQNTRTRRSR